MLSLQGQQHEQILIKRDPSLLALLPGQNSRIVFFYSGKIFSYVKWHFLSFFCKNTAEVINDIPAGTAA